MDGAAFAGSYPVLVGIAGGLTIGVFEELGWTGFALPRVRRRYSVLTTELVMGLLWAAWHFPFFASSTDPTGTVPQALVVAVLLFAWLPPYRVLMVWVYDRTGSLLIAILMHVPISATVIVLASEAKSGTALLAPVLVWGAVFWVIVAAVAWADAGHLTRRPGGWFRRAAGRTIGTDRAWRTRREQRWPM